MSNIIKPKRSNTSNSVPSTSDLAIGEIAVNIPDKTVYMRDSSGAIQTIANFAASDPNLVFPIGDYGDLSALSVDAFGIPTSQTFDALDTPSGSIQIEDLGGVT